MSEKVKPNKPEEVKPSELKDVKRSEPKEVKRHTSDVFIAHSVYPDAEAVFTTRYRNLESIKHSCVVVLDTNTLLVPYTVSKQSLDQIKTTYEALIKQNRLVVPAQVAREFAKLRARKIAELFDQLSNKRNASTSLKKEEYPLLETLEEYKTSLALEDEINTQIKKYRDTLGEVLDRVRAWTWDDPVSELYGQLFATAVVRESPIKEVETQKELERRRLHKIPPGYKDAQKDDGGIGDLIIWQTILDIGQTTKKSLVFVSHEEKADWWYRSSGEPLYPRYELIDEFRRASNGETFHMVQLSKFLDLFGANQKVIDEVKEKEGRIEEDIASIEISEQEVKVIDAFLASKFLDRSVSGLAKDSGIEKFKVKRILESLQKKGVVRSVLISNPTGRSTRYRMIRQKDSEPPT